MEAVAQPAAGQSGSAPNPLPERHGGSAPELSPVEPASPSQPGTAPIPPRPPPAATNLPNAPLFVLKGVKVIGNTVLDQSAIDAIVDPFRDHPVGLRDLEEIRRQVTLLYVDRGYINSGAILPDQNVTDGVVTLRAVEGRLTDIELNGNRYYRTS